MKSSMKDSPMPLSETTNNLYANVDQWNLAYESPCPDASADPPARMLRLSGTTDPQFADFAHPLPLELCLLSEFHPDAEALLPWHLGLVEDLDEYGIPTLLEGALPLPEKIWTDLKESLLLAARGPGYAVSLRLETREFQEKPSEFDPERNFAVIAFGFELRHRKESR